MKYLLIRYKNIKLLVNESCDMQPLIAHIQSIESLAKKVNGFYKNLKNATDQDASSIEQEKQQLISKIGYKIIGVPFTHQDAELYALDKKLDYADMELEYEREYQRISIDVEKPLKTMAVRHVNNSHFKNLTQYIEYLIKKDLGI